MVSIVYMVAGMSSRFGGKIKQFARVGPQGETLIEVSIKQAINAGYEKIVFIVGEKTEKPFKEMFGNNFQGIPIFYAKQNFDQDFRDKPWGTCDAIVCAKEVIDQDFVVCNGDDLYGETTFRSLVDFSKENNIDCATIGYKLGNVLPDKGEVNRGIFSIDKNDFVIKIDETLNISKQNLKELNLSENNLSSQNIFFLKKEVIKMLEEKLNQFKNKNKQDRKKECYLPTELSNLINEKQIKIKLIPTIDKWFGVTNPEDEEVVRKQLKQN
jgi:NDP-sugar pyrophosphorylase family protein